MECDPRALHHLPRSEAAAFATAENSCHADHPTSARYLGNYRKDAPAAARWRQGHEHSGVRKARKVGFENIQGRKNRFRRQPKETRQKGRKGRERTGETLVLAGEGESRHAVFPIRREGDRHRRQVRPVDCGCIERASGVQRKWTNRVRPAYYRET